MHVSSHTVLTAVERPLSHEAEEGRCYPCAALALRGWGAESLQGQRSTVSTQGQLWMDPHSAGKDEAA